MSTWRTSVLRSVVVLCAVMAVICVIAGSWLGVITMVLVSISPLMILRSIRRQPDHR
jgi:hypothetical protein